MAYELIVHEFYDADYPAHPLVLPTGVRFEVIRTEVGDEGIGDVLRVSDTGGYYITGARAATFRHYVRRKSSQSRGDQQPWPE